MATRAYYDGKDVLLFIKRAADTNFRAVACLDTNSFNHERELKEVTNKCTGGYRDGIAGKGTWGFEGSGQAISDVQTAEANFQELLEISVSGEKLQAKMANADGSVYRAGEIIITSYSEDANSEDPMGFTATFSGLGVPVIEAPTP
ncbi:MAG: hypothetical protein J7577_00880 [Sphingobacteriaceae bacterium]|nr:hypothetical protein [Sphingobacteriaceae bacterium]